VLIITDYGLWLNAGARQIWLLIWLLVTSLQWLMMLVWKQKGIRSVKNGLDVPQFLHRKPSSTWNMMQTERADFTPGAATWRTRRNNIVLDFGPLAPLRENKTSSTKPEIHNALHCRHRRTEPRPQATCTETLVKFGHVVFEIREWRHRQTDRKAFLPTY